MTFDFNTFKPAERVDRFTASIINRVDVHHTEDDFGETLQEAIGGVLAGLTDPQQADLYARIMKGYELVSLGQASLSELIRYELTRTNLWGIN
jgi:hypothetical protein